MTNHGGGLAPPNPGGNSTESYRIWKPDGAPRAIVQLLHGMAEQFKKAGMENVTVKLYQDARHELFNELNRDEVTADLIAWLANQTK